MVKAQDRGCWVLVLFTNSFIPERNTLPGRQQEGLYNVLGKAVTGIVHHRYHIALPNQGHFASTLVTKVLLSQISSTTLGPNHKQIGKSS